MELSQILNLENLDQYKFHAARYNQIVEPLDVFVRDQNEWHNWNRWRSNKNEFNRKYIISFIQFYPEYETWLFGGIFEVLNRNKVDYSHSYEIREVLEGQELIGRLKIQAKFSRGRSFILENIYKNLTVTEILKNKFSGIVFPGYENVDITFKNLSVIYKNNRSDWRTALQNMKGVYLITDQSNGRKYVGSAYGEYGIWARWGVYIENGHGGNKGLIPLSKNMSSYALDNFKMTLLEVWPFRTSDEAIINRENFWKQALLTRGDFGFNKN